MTDSDRRVSYGNEVPSVAMLELRKQDKQHCSLPLKHGNSVPGTPEETLPHMHAHTHTHTYILSLSLSLSLMSHMDTLSLSVY